MENPKTIYFTSITSNYIPKARVLAKSMKAQNPGVIFKVVLADALPKGFRIEDEPFDAIMFPEDFNIPDLPSWLFKHSVVEVCTALKGPALNYFLETEGANKVFYFDPDIAVLSPLDELNATLDRTGFVLTPHQCAPDSTREMIMDNEMCSLKHGIYNLGFIGVRNTAVGLAFSRWWRDRLLEFCYDDIPNGLFTDQRWVDLAPAFFDDFIILREPIYNVATWNLSNREVKDLDGKPAIGGRPIVFFHFSGYDSGAQEAMLKKYGGDSKALNDLRQWYNEELRLAGQDELGNLSSIYGFFSNGEEIKREHRKVYRDRPDLVAAFPTPALVQGDVNFYSWFKANFLTLEDLGEKEGAVLINHLLDRLHQRELELEQIRSGVAWRLLTKYYKLRDRMLPVGSQQRELIKKIRNLVKGK